MSRFLWFTVYNTIQYNTILFYFIRKLSGRNLNGEVDQQTTCY